MGLTDDDKNHVRAVWAHVGKNPEAFGAEALFRLFSAHHTTKTYFAHFDLRENSPQIKCHLYDSAGGLSKLSHLHAEKLRGEPSPLLEHYVSGTVACRHHDELDLSLDEFLAAVGRMLVALCR